MRLYIPPEEDILAALHYLSTTFYEFSEATEEHIKEITAYCYRFPKEGFAISESDKDNVSTSPFHGSEVSERPDDAVYYKDYDGECILSLIPEWEL